MPGPRVLFVDDEAPLRHAVQQGLELCGHEVTCFATARLAEAQLSRNLYGVLVSDIKMPDMDGFALLRRALEIDPALPVVLVTGHGDVPLAVEAMRAGAYDFIEKPFDTLHLASVVERALEKRRLVLEVRKLRQELETGSGLDARLVGRSAAMERLRGQVLALADTDVDVLLVGETGSGKEVVARALHDFGSRAEGPFVAINCGAVPAEIIESELFGHVAGAFTGAQKPRTGKLEFADGGTVLLDEIESMPPALQVKLLRAIETRSIERLGSNVTVPLDIRFLAASKADLQAACRAGRFREDLFYRLNVVSLAIPPLRERREDVPLLFNHLAREARGRYR
ncbi:MAG TPA: sigma-54 dependent transcriptional regulator, partial [Kiloniellaceae bacterium]